MAQDVSALGVVQRPPGHCGPATAGQPGALCRSSVQNILYLQCADRPCRADFVQSVDDLVTDMW